MSWTDSRKARQRAQIRRVKPGDRVGRKTGRRFATDALQAAMSVLVKVRSW